MVEVDGVLAEIDLDPDDLSADGRSGRSLDRRRSMVLTGTTWCRLTDPNQYRYSAKRWDAATGTYDMGARRYNPSTTRWMQQDVYFGALANLGLSSDPLTANFRSAEATRLRKALAAMLGVEPQAGSSVPLVADSVGRPELHAADRGAGAFVRRWQQANATGSRCVGDDDAGVLGAEAHR